MVKIILTGKNLIQLNFKVNIHITYNALTLILFIVLRMFMLNFNSTSLICCSNITVRALLRCMYCLRNDAFVKKTA